jgi:hypothetical protein
MPGNSDEDETCSESPSDQHLGVIDLADVDNENAKNSPCTPPSKQRKNSKRPAITKTQSTKSSEEQHIAFNESQSEVEKEK